MNEQIKKIKDSVSAFWNKQSKKNKIIILSSIGGVILISFVIVIFLNMPKYSVLYPGLDKDEAVEVIAALDKRGVEYKENNGTIMVPADKENSLRMDLSNEGHPKTSPNYDFLLNNVDMMTTEMEKQMLEKYQLNQRMEDIIETIDGIKSANVTINIPDNKGYVLSDKDKDVTTDGVSVTMNSGKELSPTQVSGIKHLLSKSVPNLTEENISVLDTATGTELMSNDLTQMDIPEFKMVIEKQFEEDIEANIMKILSPIFGTENVKVAVKSVMDVEKKIEEIITYNPSEDNRGVISEETHSSNSNDGTTSSGVPGTDSNSGTPTYPGVEVNDNTVYIKDNSSYKYLVSQVKEQIQKDSSELKDLTVSVAVNTPTIDDGKKEDILQLIANSVAVGKDKVMLYTDVFNKGSSNTDAISPSVNNDKIPLIIGVSAIIVAVLLIIIFVLLTVLKKKLLAIQKGGFIAQLDDVDDQEEEEVFDFGEIHNIKETKEQALKKEIKEFSVNNPEIAAQLIKTWLMGDDADV